MQSGPGFTHLPLNIGKGFLAVFPGRQRAFMRFLNNKHMVMVCALALAQGFAYGQTALSKSTGQSLYLPIYSHIWHGDINKDGRPMKTLISVAVSFRNTDYSNPIQITSAAYFDTAGKKIREYVNIPKTIHPMSTYELFVPLSDDAGGSGANFVITWQAAHATNQPVVEAIHVALPAGRSIAFTSSAYVLPPN